MSAVTRQAETLYRSNRNHLLWPAVAVGVEAADALRRRIRDVAEQDAPTGTTIILYGSVARGDATTESDVDLLVVFPDGTSTEIVDGFIILLADAIPAWTGNAAHVIEMTTSQLIESAGRGDALVDEWLTSEVLVGQLPVGIKR